MLLSFSRRGALPLGKIGERLQVHATSVTPLVKRLEAAGLITPTPHPEDGRAVLASITPTGAAVMDRATEAIVGRPVRARRDERGRLRRLTELLPGPGGGRRLLSSCGPDVAEIVGRPTIRQEV